MEQEWGLVANISGIDSVHGLVQNCCMARLMNYTPKRLLHNYLVLEETAQTQANRNSAGRD